MIALIDKKYTVDLSQPIDISLPLTDDAKNPIAWYQNKPEISPVIMDDWIGKVTEGQSSTNFNNIFFNPHAHGTHTECLGHITHHFYSVNEQLQQFFFLAELLSIAPKKIDNDAVITKKQLQEALKGKQPEAVIIRTLPNAITKKNKNYSHTNPPYMSEAAALFLKEINVLHLAIDLPSVDKEKDNGKLLAHKAFWNVKNIKNVNNDARFSSTITELIYVPDAVKDGSYLLNLQIASFENDASPSKPILYKIH